MLSAMKPCCRASISAPGRAMSAAARDSTFSAGTSLKRAVMVSNAGSEMEEMMADPSCDETSHERMSLMAFAAPSCTGRLASPVTTWLHKASIWF